MLTVLSVDVLCFHTIYSVVFISFLAPFYVVDFSISYYLQYCTISWGLFFFFFACYCDKRITFELFTA